MPEDFFTYNVNDLENEGFSYFDFKHILCLFVIFLIIFFVTKIFIREDERRQKKILRAVAVINIAAEFIKDMILVFIGEMDIYQLPLHLCGISLFIYVIHAYTGLNILGEISIVLCLPAAVAALLFPDWNYYPIWNFMSIHGFFGHMLLTLYPVLLLVSGRVTPMLKNMWKSILFLAVTMIPIYIFDRITGLNYYFINYPPKDTPLTILYDVAGITGYRVLYTCLLVLMIFIMYIICKYWTRRIKNASRWRLGWPPPFGRRQ